jgi:hypothetical protein
MIKLFGFAFFICSACIALATDREFGHPLFRTFTAHDYGEVGQIFAVTEDAQGRMLFGCRNAVVAFDNNHWETIPAPGTGFIRSLAVDRRGVVWFSSSTQIGYLSKVDGEYRAVKVYNGSFGLDFRVVVNGDQVYFGTKTGLLIWNKGHISQRPWSTDSMNPFSLALSHGKIWIGDRNGSIYEVDGDRFNKIAESPPTNTGAIRAIVDCPIGCRSEGLRSADRAGPDQPMLRVQRANFGAMKSGEDTELGSALAAVPTSMSGDIGVLSWRQVRFEPARLAAGQGIDRKDEGR